MNEIVSAIVFKWFLTIMTGGLAGAWVVYDSISLYRTRNADRTNPVVRDKHFGYVMGILIGAIGIIGCLRFHHVL